MPLKIFPAHLDHLYPMLEFIQECGEQHFLSSNSVDQLILATEEALVNIINYGYPGEKEGTIEIICENSSPLSGLKVTIKDHGIPFNPLEKATTPELVASHKKQEGECIGGYGLYLLISLMDHVEYQRLDGENILSLIKKVS